MWWTTKEGLAKGPPTEPSEREKLKELMRSPKFNFSRYMEAEAKRLRQEASKGLGPEEKFKIERENPYTQRFFSLTKQMEVQKHDPEFAAYLADLARFGTAKKPA